MTETGDVEPYAARIRDERRSRGWSQKQLAIQLFKAAGGAITLPQFSSVLRRIKEHETGNHRPRDPYPLLYCRVFGIHEDELFSPSATDTTATDESTSSPCTVTASGLPWIWDPEPTATAIYDMTRSDLMLDRRQAVKALAVTAGLPLVDPVQRWLAKTPTGFATMSAAGRIGLDEIAQLEATATVFRTWDHTYGGGLARKAVIGQLNEVADLLKDHHPRDITVRIFSVMAQLSKIAATMSWDSGMQSAAQKYYALGLQASKPAGDRPFGAGILASMARQLLYLDQSQDALELVRLALDGVSSPATPRLRSMLHTREAWAYAKLGRPAAFRRATEAAEDAFADASPDDHDPEWIAYFDAAELAGVTGGRYLELSQHKSSYAADALIFITRACELRQGTSTRSRALDQAGLALAHLRCGDTDEAVAMGTAATETAAQVQSDRVRIQLRELYVEASAQNDPLTRGLRDQIRETLAH
ncbi:hypothetical protein AB0K48_06840 [Nonomuraea sp. NPDC055795]